MDSNLRFYEDYYYDRQASNAVLNVPIGGPFGYDELSLTWLDSVDLDDAYNLSLQNNGDISLINL